MPLMKKVLFFGVEPIYEVKRTDPARPGRNQGWAVLKYFVLKYKYLSTFSVLKYLRKYIFQPVLKYST